jgi:hypothetical protein
MVKKMTEGKKKVTVEVYQSTNDLTTLRLQIILAMLNEDEQLRKQLKGILTWYGD